MMRPPAADARLPRMSTKPRATRRPPAAPPTPSEEPSQRQPPTEPPAKTFKFPTAFTVLAIVLLLVWIAFFFVLAVGAFITVTMKTGAIQTGIGRLAMRFRHSGAVLIALLMGVFALGGTSYGMWEETLGFFVLLVPLTLALGYDRLVAASIIFLGAGSGVIGSTVNPFATGVASDAAGITIGAGIGLRIALWVVLVTSAIGYVIWYARRVR